MFWLFVAVAALVGAIVYERSKTGVFAVPSDVLPGEPDYSPGDDPIGLFMKAIAIAEGSDASWNNPGDLTSSFGFPVLGTANSAGVLKFDTMNHGWGALRAQLGKIQDGTSKNYSLSTTLAEMGQKYSGGDSNWATNVASALGVGTDSTIGDALGQTQDDGGDS